MAELHPPIVHFAIALTIIGVIFELLGFALKRESLKHAAFWTFIVGVLAVWGAMISGEAAEEAVEHLIEGTYAEKVFEPHEELGKILPWIFTGLGLFRIFLYVKENSKLMVIYLIAAFIGIGLIGYQGRLGGKLVYEYGIGVKPLMEKANIIHKSKNEED
ncbi:DUF2231 domain-containing protein [Persephonella sp. KM09-Lau-8]|uniref:DUF2231 domain-containing protein n=1 Tax=Persephonella sp. KM09-Lau-8 TaxID=1158345 RepID=UPI0004952DB4|nr:DUF2231 domain-containing protein [Persephonella sp. KM09-Lau-8]